MEPDISNASIADLARAHVARRGIDITSAQPQRPFDLAEHLTEQVRVTITRTIPRRYWNAEPDDPQVLDWIGQYLADPLSAPNLLLKGPVGSGKTHQAFGTVRRVALETAARRKRMTFRVTTHSGFNAAMRPQPDGSHLQMLRDLQAVDLLAFDDLGAAKTTDWTDDTLYRLIDTRCGSQLPTIVTTNLDPDEFRAGIDERVVSRLSQSVQVALKGGDRRRAAGAA